MTNRSPLVSVIMPVRDGERWLAAAIDSLLSQTLRDIEVLVVNDGSKDRTSDILAERAGRDPRVCVLHQDALGLVAALNRALNEARAPLVARLDADDIALPERLQRQFEHLRANGAIGLLGSWAQRIDEAGKPIGSLKPATDPRTLAAVLLQSNPIIHSTVMMRADLVRSLGGYREAFRGAEDYDLWLRIAEHAAVANLPEILIQYRWHPGNVSSRNTMRQAFSARLALHAMHIRRSSRVDPAERLSSPPDWRSSDTHTTFYAADAALYRALDLADAAKPWTSSLDATDLTPILNPEMGLGHQERKLASLAIARHLCNARWHYVIDTLRLLAGLARTQPKIALKAIWHVAFRRAGLLGS